MKNYTAFLLLQKEKFKENIDYDCKVVFKHNLIPEALKRLNHPPDLHRQRTKKI